MIFDKFCGVVERWLPEYKDLALEAKVFMFDRPAHTINLQYRKEEIELFALPFTITCIEDPATAMIFFDSVENQIGFSSARGFLDIVPIFDDDNMNEYSRNTPEELQIIEKNRSDLLQLGMTKDTLMIKEGFFINGVWSEKGLVSNYQLIRIIVCDKNKKLVDGLPDVNGSLLKATESTSRNVMAAIEELLLVNSKKNFVLETTPKNPKTSSKKIPRCHQRPMYSILDARTIRTKMGTLASHEKTLQEGRLRNSPVPHERRRHPRRLSADGGHFKEDRVIIIPACWIGESEKVVGNKIYKVRLDI